MNPPSSEAPIHLPPPVTEKAPSKGAGEQAPRGGETAPSPESSAQAAPAAAPAFIPLPTPPAMSTTARPADNTATGQSNPAQASDIDLIEKEWVNKAKAIVGRTRDDPYKQSEELTVFKADYMKKRYNRAVKLSK
jgi:hypothetical protein